jgi:hypothetical protein
MSRCRSSADAGVVASGFAVAGSPRGGPRSGATRVGGARSGEQERGAPVGGAWSWAAGAVEADGAVWGGGTAHRGLRQRPAVGAEELEDADRGVGGG